MASTFPDIRMRRLRRTPAIRRLFDAPLPTPEKFIWPVFVKDGTGVAEPIASMPGQQRMSIDVLQNCLRPVIDSGVRSVLIFGLPAASEKSPTGSAAAAADGIVQRATAALKDTYGDELVVFTDVCLCAYTTHGHCGPLDERNDVANDEANKMLAKTAVSHATAGADFVAPSAMMDGQVAAIRAALDSSSHRDTAIMSYSTKFASSMYGPFREAEQSAPQSGDRKGYQASFADVKQAMRESELDESEGADVLMVKPAMLYLDIIARLREQTDHPIAAYNVSGEYAMLHATADRGWGDLNAMVRESLAAISRAGTDLIISYWANQLGDVMSS